MPSHRTVCGGALNYLCPRKDNRAAPHAGGNMKTPRTPSLALVKRFALTALVGWSLFLSPASITGPSMRFLRADSATPDTISDAQARGGELSRAQLLERLGVTAWHRLGQKGKGVKIAVLDTGFCGY